MKHIEILTHILFYSLFLVALIGICAIGYTEYSQTLALIDQAETQLQATMSGPGAIAFQDSNISQSDIIIFRQHLSSILPCFFATIYLYVPVALIIFLIAFATAVAAAYNPFSRIVPIARGIIQLIDSIPLVLWVFLAVIVVFRIFSHPQWGLYFSAFYYPALSLSYGMVLIVIFFQQNKRIISEIRSHNILNGEIVSGVGDVYIIWRMFRFHFAKTIMIRQLIFAFLYVLLFDYCLMYIFEGFRQSGCALTPLTVKAGLFFKRLNYYETIHMNDVANIYSHLHAISFILIVLLALISFFFLFYYFDRKDIIND